MKPLALSGIIDAEAVEDKGGLLHQWRREKEQLQTEILSLRRDLDDSRTQNEKLERTMRALRQSLSPLHRAVRAIFGEIELAIGEEDERATPSVSSAVAGATANSHVSAVWQSWISKLGGKQGDFIQTLLEHGAPMSAPQLKVATHSGSSTVSETVRKLQDLGLLDKNGSMYSLKKL